MTEKELQQKVCSYLRANNIYYFHIPQQSQYKRNQMKGMFDLIIPIKGHTLYIELKSPEKHPHQWDIKESQQNFMIYLSENRIPCLISNNYQEIFDFIEGYRNEL